MRSEDVAASVLDVAFAEDAPQALNIVNPQRPLWVKIMSSIRDAVLEKKLASLTSDDLTMVSFVDWVVQLEKRADNATPEDLANIVRIYCAMVCICLLMSSPISLRSNYSNFTGTWRGTRS